MAGVKGKSGGARPGAGRKKNPENEGAEFVGSTDGMTPVDALEFFMHHEAVPVALRIKAAAAAAPFKHKKLGEGGKAADPEAPAPSSKYGTRTGPSGRTQH
jgi:phage terminase small subunit